MSVSTCACVRVRVRVFVCVKVPGKILLELQPIADGVAKKLELI